MILGNDKKKQKKTEVYKTQIKFKSKDTVRYLVTFMLTDFNRTIQNTTGFYRCMD